MKTLILSAFAVLALASCKKDHVCSCTVSASIPNSTSVVQDVTFVKAKKSTAKKACIKTTEDVSSGGLSYVITRDCKLK